MVDRVKQAVFLLGPSQATTAESLVVLCGPSPVEFTGTSGGTSFEIDVRGTAVDAIYLGNRTDPLLKNSSAFKLAEDFRVPNIYILYSNLRIKANNLYKSAKL